MGLWIGFDMPTLAPSTTWRVFRPEVSELREPLLELWCRNLPNASSSRFGWLYESGRAEAFLLGEPRVVGSAGCLSRRFAIGGEIVEGGAAIDLNVDESQRSVGPALTLARAVTQAADQQGLACLYGLPIPSAAAVLKRCGYRQIGKISNWTKLLRSETKLRDVLRSSLAAKLVAPLVDAALRWKSSDSHRLPTDVVAESPTEFDERFDKLWRRVAKRFDVLGERTADYLTWRFSRCPDIKYEIFALTKRGELLGYVVWYRAGESIGIADLLVDDESSELLLSEFTRLARRRRADAIRVSCFGPPEFYRQLEAAGFSRRQDSTAVLVRMPAAADHWYLTMADHDTDV